MVSLLSAPVGHLDDGLVVSALPAKLVEHPGLSLPEQGLGGIVLGRQAVEGQPPAYRPPGLAVVGAFGHGLRGEAGLRNFAAVQFDHFGSQNGAAETTLK